MSHQDNLVRMANRIGQYFEAYPNESEALEGIANHIEKFWEPRMRRQLLSLFEACSDTGNGEPSFRPLVFKAVSLNLDRLRPAD